MPAATKPAPGSITKKKLTPLQAAEQWLKADTAIARNKPLREEAAAVLREHFAKTRTTEFKDLVQVVTTPGRRILDQPRVREFLGKKLQQFQKTTEPSKSIARL